MWIVLAFAAGILLGGALGFGFTLLLTSQRR